MASPNQARILAYCHIWAKIVVSKEKKELEDVVKEKEERMLKLQTGVVPSSTLLPQRYLTPLLIHEGLHVQKPTNFEKPSLEHFHPRPQTCVLLEQPSSDEIGI
jgi:hypothetical protein